MSGYVPGVLSLVLAAMGPGAPKSAGNAREVPFEPEHVSLEGFLKVEKHFGPPGFGETPNIDKRYVAYLVVLGHSVKVVPVRNSNPDTNGSAVPGVRSIRLWFPEKNGQELTSSCKKLVGTRVVVRGVLHTGIIMTDLTKVTMEVEEIAQSDKGDSAPFGKKCHTARECLPAQECVEHVGIGGEIDDHTCEYPCDNRPGRAPSCPVDMKCTAYGDGPSSSIGPICRPVQH